MCLTYFLGYIADVLEDARTCSLHASKKQIDIDDVKLAIERKLDHSFTSPPPREVSVGLIDSVFICI